MNESPRLLILGFMVKRDSPFRARDVVNGTKLSRQLVKYHLDVMVDQGLIEKFDKTYNINSKEEVIDAFINSGVDTSRNTEITDTELLDSEQVKFFNNRIQAYIALKCLGYPNYHLIRKATVESINAAIESLENGKKRLNNAQMTTGSARKYLDSIGEANLNGLYNLVVRFTGTTKEEWNEWLAALEDED